MPEQTDPESEAVTVMVARRIAPGREQEFEAWVEEALRTANTFPGYLGGGVLRPPSVRQDWHLIYRFSDGEALERWERAPQRETLLRRLEEYATSSRTEQVSGLETWFSLPGRTAPAPPRWKMAAVSLLAIYPLALLINIVVVPFSTQWPLLLRPLGLAGVLVPTMTWLVMPRMTRLFARWLYPRRG